MKDCFDCFSLIGRNSNFKFKCIKNEPYTNIPCDANQRRTAIANNENTKILCCHAKKKNTHIGTQRKKLEIALNNRNNRENNYTQQIKNI